MSYLFSYDKDILIKHSKCLKNEKNSFLKTQNIFPVYL